MAALARLLRPRLCLLATAATLAGAALAHPGLDARLALLCAGAFCLAAGCSALNQAQERRLDARMARTASRPLASGRWPLGPVLGLALGLLGLALGLWWLAAGPRLLPWGLAVIALYNGLYTPLKRRTPLALLLGGVAGALPPLVGWVGAGGWPGDHRPLLLAAVLYCWQIPHFGLLARRHRADYQAAGLPVALPSLPGEPPRFPLLVWAWAGGAAMLLAPAWGLVATAPAKALLALAALSLCLCPSQRLARRGWGFGLANLALAAFLAGLTAEALWFRV